MNHQLNLCLFNCLILILMQLDLLCFNLGLQTILVTILILLIYAKKINWFKNSLALLAFALTKFITSYHLFILELFLMFLSGVMCQILKRNLVFKKLIFCIVLLIHLVLNHWIAARYIYHQSFLMNSLLLSAFLNIISGIIIIKFCKNLLEN